MKRWLSLVLSVLLMLAALPLGTITAYADGNQCGDAITWSVEENVLTLSGTGDMWHYDFWSNEVPWLAYQSTVTKVVVEEGITSLGTNAFCDFIALTEAQLPTTLKMMGMNAFAGCIKLEEFTIPVGLTGFDTAAFANCTRMQEYKVAEGNTHFSAVDGVLFNADVTALWAYPIGRTDETYAMPDTVESVEAYAFSEAGLLKEIDFSDNLKTIKDEAFHNCVGLTAIQLPEGFLSTGGGVFQGCENLSDIQLPDSIMRVGPLSFDQTAYYNDLDNWENQVVLYLDDVVLAGRESWDEVAGEWDVELTGDYVIREGTRIVGDEAFDFLDITSITFPTSLQVIGEGAFYGCDNLTRVDIPAGVTHIYEIAFTSCERLRDVLLPDGLQHIGYNAFDETAYMISATNSEDKIVYNNGYVLGASASLTAANVKEGITLIAENAFEKAVNVTAVTLPASLRVIGAEAFLNIELVEEIAVPQEVTYIGDHAFGFRKFYNYSAEQYEYAKLDGFTLSGYTGSAAEAYAHKFDIRFNALDGCKHAYTATITTPYTCTQAGEKTYTCTLCGDTYTEVIPAQHTIVAIPAVAPGCNTPGWTEGSKCSGCDLVFAEPIRTGDLGHRVHSVSRINPDCNDVGWTEGVWCEDCQKYLVEPEMIPATGEHRVFSYDEIVPACDREGRTGGTYCGFCGETLTEPTYLPMTEHKYFQDPSVEQSATETEAGAMSRRCMNCTHRIERQELPPIQPLTAESDPKGVKLSWNAYTGAVYYRLYREVVGGEGGQQMLTTVWTTSYVDKTAQRGVTYRYTLKALNYQEQTMAATNPQEITYQMEHQYDGDCDRYCNLCGEERATEALHDYAPATCQVPMLCRVCGDYYGGFGKHDYDQGVLTKVPTCNDTGEMLYTCLYCDETKIEVIPATGKHTYDAGTVTKKATCKATGVKTYTCAACGETKTETIAKKAHSYKAATCTKAKTCKVCGATSGKKLGHKYTNACDTTCNTCKATRKITHSYKTVTKKATQTANGYTVKRCSVCKKETGKTTIYKASKISLSKTTYTYNGKAQKPTVTVKDSKGNKIASSNYTITYASGRKNVGTYKVTIKFKGKYSGTKTLTYKINPVKTTVSKLTAAKKGFKATITKKTTQVTGYEVQYSTTKAFKTVKTKTLTSYKKNTLTLTGLKAKTTYYVRVRTYKTVNGKKYYSAWSTVKTVKTK